MNRQGGHSCPSLQMKKLDKDIQAVRQSFVLRLQLLCACCVLVLTVPASAEAQRAVPRS